MKLYVLNPTSPCCGVVRIVADMAGQKLDVQVVDEAFRKSAEWKGMMTTDTFPLLKTDEGCLQQSSAICAYLATLAGGKLLGATATERSQVDQWVSYANSTITPSASVVSTGIFGWGDVMQNDWNDAAKNLKAYMKVINTSLEGKKFLVGAEATIADVIVAAALMLNFQTTLDAGFRKAMKNVDAWAQACFALPSYQKIFGNVQMCAKPLKPVCTVEKKEVKKAAPVAAAAAPKKEEKKKDNVESLPPTPFNVYDFKTFFINHTDKKGAGVDEWYKMLDWEGWSFWHFHYEKYTGEGEKLHVTNNLMSGFLSRAEHVSKYSFARHGVFGQEPNLEIMGVWLCRGPKEIPDGLLKEHPQFEYYKYRQLDPRNKPEDDKMIRDYFSAKEGDIINGMEAQTLRWVK
jgi:elongation factor 1-gamma